MKSFIIIILIVTGLLGVILIMNYPKEIPTKNSVQDITKNTIENNETCEGEDCAIEKFDNEDMDGQETEDKHEDDEEHDHSVEIEGSEMKNLTVKDVAALWEIDAEILLLGIITEFDLKGDYTIDTVLEEIRDAEHKFSPAIIKDLAEEIKYPNQN